MFEFPISNELIFAVEIVLALSIFLYPRHLQKSKSNKVKKRIKHILKLISDNLIKIHDYETGKYDPDNRRREHSRLRNNVAVLHGCVSLMTEYLPDKFLTTAVVLHSMEEVLIGELTTKELEIYQQNVNDLLRDLDTK